MLSTCKNLREISIVGNPVASTLTAINLRVLLVSLFPSLCTIDGILLPRVKKNESSAEKIDSTTKKGNNVSRVDQFKLDQRRSSLHLDKLQKMKKVVEEKN